MFSLVSLFELPVKNNGNYSPLFGSRGYHDSKRWKTGRFPTAPGTDLCVFWIMILSTELMLNSYEKWTVFKYNYRIWYANASDNPRLFNCFIVSDSSGGPRPSWSHRRKNHYPSVSWSRVESCCQWPWASLLSVPAFPKVKACWHRVCPVQWKSINVLQ